MDALERIRTDIVDDPSNAWAREAGYEPLYAASASSGLAVIGQAPGRRASVLTATTFRSSSRSCIPRR